MISIENCLEIFPFHFRQKRLTMKRLFSKKLSKYPLVCGMLIGDFGPLRFNCQGKKKIIANRIKYFKNLGIDVKNAVIQEQRHTANIKIVTKEDRGRGVFSQQDEIKNNDGLITQSTNTFLTVFTADCVPVLFFDPKNYVCGIAHAGWRGVLNLIAQKMILKFENHFYSNPSDIICYLGPAIGPCCYEVSQAKDNRVKRFLNCFGKEVIQRRDKGVYLDLKKALEIQLSEKGVLKENIEISKICTCCNRKYYLPSYYREGKQLNRSLLSVIGIKK